MKCLQIATAATAPVVPFVAAVMAQSQVSSADGIVTSANADILTNDWSMPGVADALFSPLRLLLPEGADRALRECNPLHLPTSGRTGVFGE
jgi:hypothetical protein